MRSPHSRASSRLALGLLASLALVLGGFAVATPSLAEDAHDHGTHGGDADAATQFCPPGQERRLERLSDNFADACLPGQDFAQLDDSRATLGSDETDGTKNLRHIANIPKQGAFDSVDALNSDLAFQGRYAFAGNYNGFRVIDIKKPSKPTVVADVVCPGAQNDVSVYDDLLVLSVDSSRNDDSCNSTSQTEQEKSSWEGVRVFDISDPTAPEYVAAVETKCGSHTHTLAPSHDGSSVFVYVSSYAPHGSFPDCQPPHDIVSVVDIPVDAPADAALVNEAEVFPDGGMPGGGYSSETSGCHDITAYPSKDIAAGACMGDGVLFDISDRENPVVTEQVTDTENFAFWHSATFNNTGTKVVFTDELGGGGGPTCNPTVGSVKGADGIYDLEGGELVFQSYFKIPRTQTNTENCVAHNGSLIPVKGRDIMVQAWYQGGISVVDFTDSTNPKEIAWFDRGPFDENKLTTSGAWSTYYYNGHIYSNEIQHGFDVFDLRDPRTASAKKVRFDELNVQSQPSY